MYANHIFGIFFFSHSHSSTTKWDENLFALSTGLNN